ncbi:hypothetical protein ACQPZJ_35555 [Actinoplanes sp. CA-054009]
MSIFGIIWLIWLGIFVVVEGVALFNKKPGDTLSEHVWKAFATQWDIGRERTGWQQAKRFVLLAFMVWLTIHFLTGGWV